MNRRIQTIGLVAAAILAIGAGILAYMMVNSYLWGNGSQPNSNTGPSTPTASQGCGVTKTGGSYTFSWLHISRGYFVDDKNCIVNLKGFNWAQLEFGNGVGGGPKTRISADALAWYSQTFHTNVWRIPVNAVWWNQDVEVPLANMKYQDWIQQIVKWAEENGNYIILTKGPQFPNPPCGGGVKVCPSQNQGKKNFDLGLAGPDELTSGQYIQPAVTMWTSIAKRYSDDPAVLYDSWNEMNAIDAQTWYRNTNTLIETIRAQNPRSVIFLGGPDFKGDINPIIQRAVPDFAQSNLVYDFHVYDGFKGTYLGKNCNSPLGYLWQSWPNHANEQVSFSQHQGKAVAFSEWGGCNDFADYNQAITSYARTYHICLAYYDQVNVATKTSSGYQITDNGLRVQAAYATL